MGDGEKLLTHLNSALKVLLGLDIFPRVSKKKLNFVDQCNCSLCCKQNQVPGGRQTALWAPHRLECYWRLATRMFRRCIGRYGTVRAVTRPGLRNIWNACTKWDAERFSFARGIHCCPIYCSETFYTNREQCEVLTGYLSLGCRPVGNWANT